MRNLAICLLALFLTLPASALRIKSFGINTLDEIDDLGCDEAQAVIWNDTLKQWECDFAGGDIVLKTVDESVADSDVLQDDDELFFSLLANTTYTITGVLIYTSATTVPNVQVAFESPDISTMSISIIAGEGNVNVSQQLYRESNIPKNFDIASGAFAHLRLNGVIIMGSQEGIFRVRWSQQVSGGTATVGVSGSFINFRRFRP